MSAWWETTRRTCSRLSRPWGKAASFSCGTARSSPRSTFMGAARAMGIEPPLDPIMGMIFLPLPVIPTLRIRPEGMFDVTRFQYA